MREDSNHRAGPAPYKLQSIQLDILALEPFFGGARKAMLETIMRHSRHRWTLLKLPPTGNGVVISDAICGRILRRTRSQTGPQSPKHGNYR